MRLGPNFRGVGRLPLNSGSGPVDDAVSYHALKLDGEGQIYAVLEGTIHHYASGLPFDEDGRLVVTTTPPERWDQGTPFSSTGAVCVDGAEDVLRHDQGASYTTDMMAGDGVGTPLPPVDLDNVYQGFGAENVVYETGIDLSQPNVPMHVAARLYVIEHTDLGRHLISIGDGVEAIAQFSLAFRITPTNQLEAAVRNTLGLRAGVLTPDPLPTGRWLTVRGGWEGGQVYVELDGVRNSSGAANYDPFDDWTHIVILGGAGATQQNYADQLQLARVVVDYNDNEVRLAAPCAEGEGLESLDYSQYRNNGVISDDIVHQQRLEDLPDRMPVFEDLFDRPDGDLSDGPDWGPGWSNESFFIEDNAIVTGDYSVANPGRGNLANTLVGWSPTPGTAYEIELECRTPPTGGGVGNIYIGEHASVTSVYTVRLQIFPEEFGVAVDDGLFDPPHMHDLEQGDRIRLRIDNGDVVVYLNDVEVLTNSYTGDDTPDIRIRGQDPIVGGSPPIWEAIRIYEDD